MGTDPANYVRFNFANHNHSIPDMSELTHLYSNNRPIAESKLRDIQKFKQFVPALYHPFYDYLARKATERRALHQRNQNKTAQVRPILFDSGLKNVQHPRSLK
ncbi:hypothetical protein ANN_04119 [Periplaneta americana]|uniref:Uncharacterized protein n=1 Tax=Periplaneta americana TaxID=6978 RepID=A0ABQ8T9P7_PERAM|nr:hypothetical protein ANN_04119 [Periplaneta americana]